ncbi:histone-lysine N-methyltransferase PRDM9-like [Mytilus trossulus]|uniref:histone-lysine N-methyltransferase PRDM9-like n=1 Tax=Mytilus trossulus TaxID=6551 RepID=UPI00300692DF
MLMYILFGFYTISSPSVCEKCDGRGLVFSKDMFIVNNVETNLTDDNRPLATLPTGLSIRPSGIPEAGSGVFAERSFPKGTRFGPYGGKITENIDNWSYAFNVYGDDDSVKYYVDALYKNNSNWLRYVNCARTVHEENVYVLQLNEEVFYVTYECITEGTELLVWYGPDYGEDLGLQRKPEDYQERFHEQDVRYVIENTITENVHKLYTHCYKFFNQAPFIKPPGENGTFDKYCFHDGSYQVCLYSECNANPCTNQTDCKDCDGYCLHQGKYFKATEKFKHVDTINTCVCNEDGHFGCTIFSQFTEYICS